MNTCGFPYRRRLAGTLNFFHPTCRDGRRHGGNSTPKIQNFLYLPFILQASGFRLSSTLRFLINTTTPKADRKTVYGSETAVTINFV
ncbi:MAG: hypothetical protein JXD22_04740 [Sedimentisphaerales bacterium]|nr:hypothetical protein [Sedimentisphaerales bacterium]